MFLEHKNLEDQADIDALMLLKMRWNGYNGMIDPVQSCRSVYPVQFLHLKGFSDMTVVKTMSLMKKNTMKNLFSLSRCFFFFKYLSYSIYF